MSCIQFSVRNTLKLWKIPQLLEKLWKYYVTFTYVCNVLGIYIYFPIVNVRKSKCTSDSFSKNLAPELRCAVNVKCVSDFEVLVWIVGCKICR